MCGTKSQPNAHRRHTSLPFAYILDGTLRHNWGSMSLSGSNNGPNEIRLEKTTALKNEIIFRDENQPTYSNSMKMVSIQKIKSSVNKLTSKEDAVTHHPPLISLLSVRIWKKKERFSREILWRNGGKQADEVNRIFTLDWLINQRTWCTHKTHRHSQLRHFERVHWNRTDIYLLRQRPADIGANEYIHLYIKMFLHAAAFALPHVRRDRR